MDGLEAKFRIRVDGKDELTDFFSRSEGSARSFQANMRAALGDTAKTIASFTKGLGKDLLNASGVNLGIAANAKQVLEFRDSLQRLVISAQVGDDQIAGLKQQILETSAASNQAAPAIAGALQAFVEKTGDIDTARKNLALYAQTATATAAAIEDVAQVGVQLSDKLNVKDQAKSFAILATQAKLGAIELKDLATYAPRIFSSGASLGLTGERGVREAGALAQVYAKAFGGRGSGASVATAVESTFRDITKKANQLEAGGIKVAGRDPIDVIFDIIKRTNGDPRALNKIFDARSARGVTILANEFRRTGGFGTFEHFRDVSPTPGLIDSDAARAKSTGMAALQHAQNDVFAATDRNLGDAADALAQHSGLLASSYNAVTAHPLIAGGAGIAGLLGLNYARRAVMGGVGRAVGGPLGALLGGGGVAKVEVTNWPASFGGPGAAAAGALEAGAGVAGVAAGAVGVVAAGALGALAVHDYLLEHLDLRKPADRLKADLAAGKKRRVQHWYNFGGASIEDVPASEQAAAARQYQIQNHVKVEIHGDEATITDASGTRSTVALERRRGGG